MSLYTYPHTQLMGNVIVHLSSHTVDFALQRREDAAKAIQFLNGYGYDHLILSVEWAK